MSTIPSSFQIIQPLHQRHYLLDGELKQWQGETTDVFSTISSTDQYQPTLLGSIPNMKEKEALEALDSSVKA